MGRAERRTPAYGTSHPLDQLRTEIDRLLSDFLRGYWHVPFRRSAVDVEPIWRGEITLGATPAVDIVDKDDCYKLTAELPGVDEKQVEIRFSNGTLTIEGKKDEAPEDARQDHFVSERHYGDFHRTFRVPDGVDADKIEASFKNGVLSVKLPKTAEARRKQKKVEIKSA
jgi:HSP20 family protein